MNNFESFCTKTWLNYCNETPPRSNKMTRDEYIERWYDWLLDKWQNRDYRDETIEDWISEKRQNKDKALQEALQKKKYENF